MLLDIFNKSKNFLEYLPIFLIALLLITEQELEKHAVKISCQVASMTITACIFFIIVLRFKGQRAIAFIICIIVWAILVCLKERILNAIVV